MKKKYKNNQIFTIATSCTSGANGILYAKQFLEMGYAKRAIIVGFESYNALTLNGFHALGLLCPQHSFPFSSHSEGLILGEGIAVIAMSTAPNNSPNNHIKSKEITLAGGANICDTHNITGTHPDGNKVVQIIQKALDNANIDATQINAIKAHATGCQSGDTAEVLGISKLFPSNIPIAIFKPYIGHTLGACGVLELILLIISLKQGALPAMPKIHQNHFEQFEKFDTQTILPFHLVSQGIPLTEGYYLLNYLGFGGSNTALILGFH